MIGEPMILQSDEIELNARGALKWTHYACGNVIYLHGRDWSDAEALSELVNVTEFHVRRCPALAGRLRRA